MPDLFVLLDLESFVGRLLARAVNGQDANGGEFRVCMGVEGSGNTEVMKLLGGNSCSREDIKNNSDSQYFSGRDLHPREAAFFSGCKRLWMHSTPGHEGRAMLRRLTRCGFSPDDGLIKKIDKADALASGRTGAYSIDAAVALFGAEKSMLTSCLSEHGNSEPLRLTLPEKPELRLSGRIDPGGINQGLLIHGKTEKMAAPDPGLLAQVISHEKLGEKGKDRALGAAEIERHLAKGRQKELRFGDLPDQGVVLASRLSGNKLSFDLALPRSETKLADLLAANIEAMPMGRVDRHNFASRLVLKATAQGNTQDLTRTENFARAHAPMAARPVRMATLSLFLPFECKPKAAWPPKDISGTGAGETKEHAANVNYFLPHLEPLFGLAEPAGNAPFLDTTTTSQNSKLHVAHPSYSGYDHDAPRLSREIKRVCLHRVSPRAVLLEVRIDTALGVGGEDEQIDDNFTFAELLDFTAFARRVRRQYGGEAPNAQGEKQAVQWWQGDKPGADPMPDLLTAMRNLAGVDDEEQYRYLGDDRAFVMQSVILDGTVPEPDTGAARQLEIALERLNSVDGWGDKRFYSPGFSRKEYAASAYPRFADTGSTFLSTAHSFSFLGFAGRWAGDIATDASFAEALIHPAHMQHVYRWMVVYALLVRTELNLFEENLGKINAGAAQTPFDEVREEHQAFTHFVHGTWRETVSSQVQGQELFAHITDRLAIRDRIARLSTDFAAIDRIAAQQHRARQALQESHAELQRIAFAVMVGIATAVLTLFQVLGNERKNYFPLDMWHALLRDSSEPGAWLWNHSMLFLAIAIFTATAFVLSMLLAPAIRKLVACAARFWRWLRDPRT